MQTRLALCLFTAAVIIASVTGCDDDEAPAEDIPATFVGQATCAQCHPVEHDLWSGSHHDQAMQIANDQTVLGDFEDSSFTHFGVTSSFYKRDDKFYTRTDGPDGELHEYEVKYTFGVTPLQQYLIEFPGGRLQPLSICWDTRPESEGGQRWFHLYGDEEIPHDDILHWTGRIQNWNNMCAECHSTDLRKNYDRLSDTFWTEYSEMNVSCEACHGPGSDHVDWAEALERGETPRGITGTGLQITLKDPVTPSWVFDPDAVTARREPPLESQTQVEACARCHSRRGPVTEYTYGRPLADTHRPALLEELLYHADGQILDEVYVYGSFLQSKMYQQGVRCSDCHEPHGLNLISQGNSLCSRCHSPEVFDTPDHHFHETGSTGASCVECHMPASTYMVVDPRRDHSIRIPRPDLSVSIGTPNACSHCHEDQSAEWAAEAVEGWYEPKTDQPTHYAEVLHAGRELRSDAPEALAKVVTGEYPGIVRASAMQLLGRFSGTLLTETIDIASRDPDPLVRRAALEALRNGSVNDRLRIGYKLLADPIRTVRIEAVFVLAVARSGMTISQQQVFRKVAEEYIADQEMNADQAGANFNLGNLYGQIEEYAEAEPALRRALELDPTFIDAHVVLADVLQRQGRGDEGEAHLREALRDHPSSALIHHALGLLLVQLGRKREALDSLSTASDLAPENARFALYFGVALHDAGQAQDAISVLEAAHQRSPRDVDLVFTLATIHRDLDLRERAIHYAKLLVALDPRNSGFVQFLRDLERGG